MKRTIKKNDIYVRYMYLLIKNIIIQEISTIIKLLNLKYIRNVYR